ncbi:MAG: TonB-dependent receptor [Candidatus Marinimicrobia bacterium]|jgi:outer membrane receptor protein involved in Fe transport|nr:TonB-dependent receptor [Candidatus Neomarinimicrobiota bacterium]MBT3936331.1 TonB-dependent receptor [Candidatus Neomarinimicrobiota bacterium]MBT3960283.1 TonB-dependent receptor [Candidatus Neomarinimicrobiota bacterium]MBT4383371.1 TonB-dependent receptor [Candidatus Neomarinimicrobiota bacterium]MBT4635384.1 TonB-dependent receptor [Candidatus Neomarinimicrobiota bacterium]
MIQRKTFQNIIFIITLSSMMLAGTGKVAGVVTSKDTGEPLPGVNVFINETGLGSATDMNGDFTILNIPPGLYTLQISYIGYATYKIQGIRVSTDQTTRQNLALTQEVIEGEEVVVLAERSMVQKDLTASQTVRTADEIKDLPVESFLGVLATQAGVNQGAGGELHIRGGRSNEIGYYIDGVSVSNPFFTNSLAINVSNQALEEMKVVSGAFNAEYGNAMSGIVNIQIKEGGQKYEGSVSYYSGDYMSNDTDIYTNIDDINMSANRVVEGTLSGPVPGLGKKLTFNISGKSSNNEGYLFGVREHLPDDFAYFPASGNWYVEMSGDSSYVPMNPRSNFNGLAKLTLKVSPRFKISTQALISQGEWKSYVHSYKYNPDGTYNYMNENYNYSIKINHALNEKSFYEANFFQSTTDFKQYTFEDPSDAEYVSTDWIDTEPSSATFVFGGTQMGHSYRESISQGGKIDFTSQLTTHHEIKTGVSARIDNLIERNYTVLFDDNYDEPTVLEENKTPYHNFYNSQALIASGYIQDKIEYDNVIVNAGVRYDQFDPKTDYIANLLDPEGEKETAEQKKMVSPRLGIAFPITDEGILHFSYGHFYQMPTLRRLYKTSIFGAGLSPSIGFGNLKPEKTVLYEFGLQQELNRFLAIDMSIFYKDIRDLLALQSIHYESPKYGPADYSIYQNKDYGSVKGITASLTKRYDRATKVAAWIDYSYQVAEGNSLQSGSFFFNALTGEEEEKKIVPLSWDQRHILNGTVMFGIPGNWTMSFIGKISSGWPYTPDIVNANYVPDPNSDKKPWLKNLNMRFQKSVKLGSMNYGLFVKVFNLLDMRNERYVFDDTGRAGYTYGDRSSQESEELKRHYGEAGIHTWSEYMTRPQYYTSPRSVTAGFTLEF